MRCCSALALTLVAATSHAAPPRSAAEILKASKPEDWRPLDPQSTVVIDGLRGRVVIELARRFAPLHVDNIRTLVREGYFDKSKVVRVQDNYVVQWGDPDADDAKKAVSIGSAKPKVPTEIAIDLRSLQIAALPDRDEWAPLTGFVDGMPVAADPTKHQAWIPHCYGVVGVGRDNAIDSGNGSSLYAVIGQSPRRLDLNITVVGRVIQGMNLLAALPRGNGAMGFYEKPEENVPLGRVRMLADVPMADRPRIEVMRTDSATWKAWIEAARNPPEEWFVHRHDHTNVCNVNLPTRPLAAPAR
jgi:peptidylprolyl isomerase